MFKEVNVKFFPENEGGGGGWSFLQLCEDDHGEQWTGLHKVMDELLMLAIATKHARILLPRELWSALPGGMPYIMFSNTVLDSDE